MHTCAQSRGNIGHNAGGNVGPLQIQNRVTFATGGYISVREDTIGWRKIEYNGKDNIGHGMDLHCYNRCWIITLCQYCNFIIY